MKHLISFIIASILIVSAAPALAQTTPALAELQIDIRPEFDKPSTLIIYRGTLDSNSQFPVNLSFDIPANITPLAVAYKDAQGNLLDLKYTTTTGKDSGTISFSAPTAFFQFEYYDKLDTLTPARKFNFAARVAYPIQKLTILAQQPPTARDFTTMPPIEIKPEPDGLSYARYTKNNLQANETISLNIAYTKNDSLLTSPPVQPVAIATTPADTSSPVNSTLLYTAIGIVAILALFGGVIWYTRRHNESAASSEPHPRRNKEKGHPPRPREVNPTKSAGSAGFCHNCGEPSSADDMFCRKCGTKIRR